MENENVKVAEVKPPISFDEQLIKFKARCSIEDEEYCLEALKSNNYYRLTAYLLPYKNSVCFEKVYKTYEFDRKMRVLLFSIIEEIELYLRTQFSYYHAHKYGALGYEECNNFSKYHKHDIFTKNIDRVVTSNKDTLVIKHHNEKYGGKIPLWVIIELFTVGMLSYFYSDMYLADRKKISALFDVNHAVLNSWLKCFTELRNMCAHYSRLYFWKFTTLPKIPENDKYINTGRLFDQIYMLKHLYTNKDKWNNVYLVQFESLIEEYEGYIEFNHIGFPVNWKALLTNAHIKTIHGTIESANT